MEYELDEGLISFGSCLERGQYAKAVDLLEDGTPGPDMGRGEAWGEAGVEDGYEYIYIRIYIYEHI